jgi:hypothetical protein
LFVVVFGGVGTEMGTEFLKNLNVWGWFGVLPGWIAYLDVQIGAAVG